MKGHSVPVSGITSLAKKDGLNDDPQPQKQPQRQNDSNITDDTMNPEGFLCFDSIAIEFSVFVFLHQLAVHLFHPWLIFTVNRQAQGFTPSWTTDFMVYNVLQTLCYYGLWISYAATRDPLVNGLWLLPVLYHLLHKIVVAVKYGCLSKSEYERFQKSSKRIGIRYRKQMELVSGWLMRDPIVRDFEIAAAIARVGLRPVYSILIRLNHSPSSLFSKILSENMRNWRSFLSVAMTTGNHDENQSAPSNSSFEDNSDYVKKNDGTYVNIFDVCTAIIKNSDNNDYGRSLFQKVIVVLSAFNSFLVFMPLIQDQMGPNPSHISAVTIICFICVVIVGFPYFVIVFQFMYVGVFDISRQLNMMTALKYMIRINDISKDFNIYLKSPTVMPTDEQRYLQEEILSRVLQKRKGNNDFTANSSNILTSFFRDASPRQGKPPHGKSSITSVHSDFDEDPYRVSIGDVTSPIHNYHEEGKSSRDIDIDHADTTIEGHHQSQGSTDTSKDETNHNQSQPANDLIPRLKLDCPGNVVGWTYMCLIIYVYGKRYRFRLQTYSTIIIILFALLLLLTLSTLTYSPDPRMEIDSVYTRQSLLAITLTFIYIASLIYMGSQVNDCLQDHINILSQHTLNNQLKCMNLRKRIRKLDEQMEVIRTQLSIENKPLIKETGIRGNPSEASPSSYHPETKASSQIKQLSYLSYKQANLKSNLTTLSDANEAIDRCIDVLTIANSAEPFTVLGIQAQPALLTSLMSTAIAFYLTVYAFYNPSAARFISNME